MLKYSTKSRQTLTELVDQSAPPHNVYRYQALNPKNLPYKPPTILISKRNAQDILNQAQCTPRTAKPTYEFYAKTNNSFSKSINATPEKDRIRKDSSFTKQKCKENEPIQSNQLNKNFTSMSNSRTVKADLSQRLLKTTTNFQELLPKEDNQKNKLRQTVANSGAWQYKNLFISSPVKTTNQLTVSKGDNTYFRKKMESDYLPSHTKKQDKKVQIKPNILFKQHSRNTSITQDNNQAISTTTLQTLHFKSKQLQSTKITPRRSQQKLTTSSHLARDKTMSQTDPNGNYFELALNKNKKMGQILSRSKETPFRPGDLCLQDFQLGSCKGQGRFGKVFSARHKKTGWLMAIKQVQKESVRMMMDQFIQQIKISLFLNHPNVVKMYGCFLDKSSIYIMMEYMEEGSLYRTIKLSKKLCEDEVAEKLTQVCEAVNYLHSHDILHRDIKPENIVLSNDVCKLCDFGWATYSKQRRSTYCGTLDYVCPEILEGQSYDNFVDIWAIGVLAYQMLAGKAPFYHISRKQTMKSIMKCDFSFPPEMSLPAKLFITKALQKNPDERFTIESLLHDRFLSQTSSKTQR